jgi:hypothetical protein
MKELEIYRLKVLRDCCKTCSGRTECPGCFVGERHCAFSFPCDAEDYHKRGYTWQ